MDHCLLFGSCGRLPVTKFIPHLKRRNVPYTPVSRARRECLTHLDSDDKHVAYMSIPLGDVVDAVDPYSFEFLRIRPTFILEKHHEYCLDDLVNVCNYLDFLGHEYVFCDHRMFNDEILNIDTRGIDSGDVNYINVTVREEGLADDLLDVYRSHVVLMFASMLSRVYPDDTPSRVLEGLSNTGYSVVDTYAGKQDKRRRIYTKYKNTNLSSVLENKAKKGETTIHIQTSSHMHKIHVDSNGYDKMFNHLIDGRHELFLSRNDVDCLWRHVKLR